MGNEEVGSGKGYICVTVVVCVSVCARVAIFTFFYLTPFISLLLYAYTNTCTIYNAHMHTLTHSLANSPTHAYICVCV